MHALLHLRISNVVKLPLYTKCLLQSAIYLEGKLIKSIQPEITKHETCAIQLYFIKCLSHSVLRGLLIVEWAQVCGYYSVHKCMHCFVQTKYLDPHLN